MKGDRNMIGSNTAWYFPNDEHEFPVAYLWMDSEGMPEIGIFAHHRGNIYSKEEYSVRYVYKLANLNTDKEYDTRYSTIDEAGEATRRMWDRLEKVSKGLDPH